MKISQKLDLLREMACEFAGDKHRLYLISLLAEHVEEKECTEELLGWVRKTLLVTY